MTLTLTKGRTMNLLFERLSLQGHLRRILDQYPEQGWQIIQAAIERELNYSMIRQQDEKAPN